MRTATFICVILLIVPACSIERADSFLADSDYHHAVMRKHFEKLGCDLFFELDDGTIIVPYMLTYPLMMPDGQEVEFTYTVMEDIEAGCLGGVAARITGLRQTGCGPVIDLGLDFNTAMIPADDFTILSADMEEDCLKLAVSYSGGCEIHEFLLYAEPLPAFDEIHGMLSLVHYGHEDPCDGIVRDSVFFDLSFLQRRSAGYSRLVLSKGYGSGAVIYIDYYY